MTRYLAKLQKSPRKSPETILVYVGLDLMGDGLTKLPFVRALRNAYPDARITWLAGKGKTVYAGKLKPLVEGLIDEVIEEAGIGSRWSELRRRPLPGQRFDLILDSQRRVITTLVLRRIRHGTFISGCANFLFSDLRPPGGLGISARKPAALIDQLLQLVALAKGGRRGAAVDIRGAARLPETAVSEAIRLLPDGENYIAMAPGAGERMRCWPLENYMALGARLAAQGLIPVYLLGPAEGEWHAPLRAGVPEARFPLNEDSVGNEASAALELEPLLSMALAARARVCIANDSGGGHIMAASGAPLIWLCGPTPPEKFAPRIANLTIVKAQYFGSADMSSIPIEAVEAAIRSVMSL